MKTLLSLSALLITLTLTAQSNPATWYLNDTSGNGIQSPFGSTASGEYSTAIGANAAASGYGSLAAGVNLNASGVYSTAIGLFTTSSGYASTAIGDYTTASGMRSTAMGVGTIASGYGSTAIGDNTIASDNSSLVVGRYNLLGSTVTNNSATDFILENPAFVIGNGTDENNRSDALTVLFDGTTNVAGSVTATSFIGDGSQLTNLPSSSPFSLNDTSGNGIQSNTNTASGNYSIAMGHNTTASGDYSIAMGRRIIASGVSSTSMGDYTIASGYASTAMGYETTASGNYSIAMGFQTTASRTLSTAMGFETTASGGFSTAMGFQTTASGQNSIAMGCNTTASDRSSLVIGEYNLLGSIFTNNADEFNTPPTTAFVIGNGIDADNRSDALTVLFDGTTTIAGDLSINSDARLKANIISLGSTLAKLLQIDGKTYTMKKDENKKQKIGVLAQDIEKVFPELVSESNGVKSVNYQGLVPVLINALKEQDSKMNVQENKMNEQEAKLNKQQAEIDELKAIVTKLITP